MKFAFIVHPVSETHAMIRLDGSGEFRKLWHGASVLAISDYLQVWMAANANRGQKPNNVTVIDELRGLCSINGHETEGRLYQIPMSAAEIMEAPAEAMAHVERAIAMAADWGAGIVGLGSMTAVIGGQGVYLAKRSPIAVTTGNSLTVYAALKNLDRACDELNINLATETVAIVGAPGSIASGAARLLARQVGKLILVARRQNRRAEELAARLDAELLLDIPSALKKARVVISATSTGACIDPADLQPGSLVIDVGVPADVKANAPKRNDVLIVSGGLVRIPDTMSRDCMFLAFYYGIVPACLAETMNLALEGRAENYSLGRDLDLKKIREIGKSAEQNG
jgi:putrescine aminotransferase